MEYRSFLESVLAEASKIALSYRGKVTSKTKPGDNNQVLTEADLVIGKYLQEKLKVTYPRHNTIDEEAGVVDKGSRFTWVIDPIEGTSNFASGSDDYGIMIGLLEGTIPIAGGVSVPSRNLTYIAERGKGATKNGQRLKVTSEINLQNVLVSIGIDAYPDNPQRTRRECELMRDVILAIRNMRNSGCEAVDSMLVAEGIYGGRINLTSKIWDNVAPQIIVEESGGLWTDVHGMPIDYTNPLTKFDNNFTNCLASPGLHKQLMTITNKHKEIV